MPSSSSFRVGGGRAAAFCIYISKCLYEHASLPEMMKMLFFQPKREKKLSFLLSPAAPHRNFHISLHEMFSCFSYVLVYVGFFLFCCLGFHLNALNEEKVCSPTFCARILSIFPLPMRYVVSVSFRFPQNIVMDFCVGHFRIRILHEDFWGLFFVYLCQGTLSFYQCFRL